MARAWMSIVSGILLAARAAAAQPDPALDRLEKALPPGWSLLATDAELVIRHDRPCYVTGRHHPDAHAEAAGSAFWLPLPSKHLRKAAWARGAGL